MSIAIVSLIAGQDYSRAVMLATRSKTQYSRLHGYDFVTDDVADPTRPPAWSKIPLIQRVLPQYDAVFWLDADAMVVNYGEKLEDFFEGFLKSDKKMIATIDAAGNQNTGSFVIKNDPWSLQFLQNLWTQEQFINHGWWENRAFIYLLGTDRAVSENVQLVPNWQMPFNSYPHHDDYRKGDLVVHFAGVHDLCKLEGLIARHYRRPSIKDHLQRLTSLF